MNEFNSKWRICAKAAGICELIFSIAILIVIVVLAFLCIMSIDIDILPSPLELKVLFGVCIIIAILVNVSGVLIRASVQLIQAAKLGQKFNEAYKCCQYWLITNIVREIVFGPIVIVAMNWVEVRTLHKIIILYYIVIGLLIKAFFYLSVCLFMRDLKAANVAHSQTA